MLETLILQTDNTNTKVNPFSYNGHHHHNNTQLIKSPDKDNNTTTSLNSKKERDSFLNTNTNHFNGLGTGGSQSKLNHDSVPFPNSTQTPFNKLINDIKNDPMFQKEAQSARIVNFYRLGDEVGKGNFSQVKLGVHLLTKEKVAIKILDKMKLDEKTQRLLFREIASMDKLHHPNIIRLYEVIYTQTRLYICMEYAPDGELYTYISNNGKMNETEARYVFSQIVSAVDHMHSQNIIHRDLKAENIFFYNRNRKLIKVGDFGFSTQAASDKLLNTYCGSPPYAAPELFRDDNYIGIYVDIWALGVLLFFMVTSNMPFRGLNLILFNNQKD
jgi:serine/threonine-protein kinase NIM1